MRGLSVDQESLQRPTQSLATRTEGHSPGRAWPHRCSLGSCTSLPSIPVVWRRCLPITRRRGC